MDGSVADGAVVAEEREYRRSRCRTGCFGRVDHVPLPGTVRRFGAAPMFELTVLGHHSVAAEC